MESKVKNVETLGQLVHPLYMEIRKENYDLKEMLRKEQEEKLALQMAYRKLKEAYDELEAESGKGAKPIATAVKIRTLKFNIKQMY